MSFSAPARTPARPRRERSARPAEPFPVKRRSQLPFKRDLQPGTVIAAIALATLAGAAIRLAITRGLSLDEILMVDTAHLSPGRLITHLMHRGTTPPLYPILDWLAMRAFGGGDFAVRVPSLLAGVALIPTVAWLAAELFDRRTAVTASVLMAVAPVLTWYSQEASGYALVALFGSIAIIGASRAVRRGRPEDWALHALACALAVWSDWSGIFIVLATEITLAVRFFALRQSGGSARAFTRSWGLDTLALACQLIPLGVLAAQELDHNGGIAGVMSVGAGGLSFYTGVSNVAWGLFGFHPGTVTSVLSAVWPLAMLASLVVVGRGVSLHGFLLLVCAVVPVLCVFALGAVAPQAFDVRYMLAAVPPVIVLLARAATGWPRGGTGRMLVAGGILVVLAGALIDQQTDARNPRRYDYQRALDTVRAQARPGTAILYEPSNLRAVLARYAPDLRAKPLSTHLPTRPQASGVVVMTSFNGQPALIKLLDREIGALRATRRLVSYHGYPGVDLWHFR